MLDMDLLRGRPALRVEFRTSLAADLLDTMGLVMNAQWYEGLDQWVYETHAALPATLRADIEQILILTEKAGLLIGQINQLAADHPAHTDFSAFIGWLNSLSEADFHAFIEGALEHLARKHDDEAVSPPSLDDPEALKAFLEERLGNDQAERAAQLAGHPAELKAQYISVVTRFWEQFYRQEYQRCLPLMERSVEHHRRQNYTSDFHTVFTAVTGRRYPKGFESLAEVERLIFVPSCHIGPYVASNYAAEPRPTMTIHYNCRPTGAPERDQTPAIQDIFPPIKALADETRLQILSILDGRQLYAQEIVAQLDISQSAVSRHLRLMVAGGLLDVDKQDSMKYYSINEETLAALADRLSSYRAKRA